MAFRLVLADAHAEFRTTLRQVAGAAAAVLPIGLEVAEAASVPDLRALLRTWAPDAVLMDWELGSDRTALLIEKLQEWRPGIRIMVMLPDAASGYRETVWAAGACAGIPRDRLDAEWLATAVCLMFRAGEREERLLACGGRPQPAGREPSG